MEAKIKIRVRQQDASMGLPLVKLYPNKAVVLKKKKREKKKCDVRKCTCTSNMFDTSQEEHLYPGKMLI